MTKTAAKTRSIEIKLDVAAAPEDVWRALTDAKELMRWFPIKAEVQPGVGGRILTSWDDLSLRGFNTIAVWEPGRHLRTGWFEPNPDAESVEDEPDTIFYKDVEARRQLVVDYFLEGKGGGTVLRLVHSGFSMDESWDEEFEGHRRGWTFELRSLRNYVENHLGKDRHIAWITRQIDLETAEAWSRITSNEAMLAEGSLDGLAPNDRYGLTTVHADRFEGQVIMNEAPWLFAGTIENLDHSLLRAGVEDCTGVKTAMFWVSTWGEPTRSQAISQRWNETFARLFGE